jgi:hypothetical protein
MNCAHANEHASSTDCGLALNRAPATAHELVVVGLEQLAVVPARGRAWIGVGHLDPSGRWATHAGKRLSCETTPTAPRLTLTPRLLADRVVHQLDLTFRRCVVRVDLRRLEVRVAEISLDRPQRYTRCREPRRERVPQIMEAHRPHAGGEC